MSNLKAYLASSTLQFRLIVALIFMAIGLAEALAPLPILVDKFLPDDAFYYFTTAAYFARDGVPTFDGTNVTSGFHPLWLLISAFFYLFFANGSIIALRALLILQTLFSAGSVFLLFRTIGTYLHPLALVIPTGLFLIFSAAEFVNGLETPLVLLMTASIIVFLLRRGTPQESLVTGADRITFSVLLGLLFLARTDQGFTALIYIAIAALFWLPRRSLQQWFGALLQLGIPAAVLGIGYLTYNWALTGHPMQVSGEAKTFYSAMHFANAVQVQGSEQAALLANFAWLYTMTHGQVLLGIYGFGLLLGVGALISFFRGRPTRFDRERLVLATVCPFVLGAICSLVYYHLRFFGPFSSTAWYYSSHYFLGIPVLGAFLSGLFRIISGNVNHGRKLLALVCVILFVFTTYLVFIGTPELWIPLTIAGVLGVATVFLSPSVALLFLALLAVKPLLHIRSEYEVGPSAWNYALYEGALWAKEYTQPTATIWSGSAGVLGYFSGRKVINTDGLINSYEFLENVLTQNKVFDYTQQFDYAIDAWGAETDLVAAYPGGCEIKLPRSVRIAPFFDGSAIRKLRVYKMKRNPGDPCRRYRKSVKKSQ